MVDGCFVVVDLLSLAAIQPEGAVAAEVVHAEVKAAAREGSGRSAANWSSRGRVGRQEPGASEPEAARRPAAAGDRGCHPPARPLVDGAVGRGRVSGVAPASGSTAPDEPGTGSRWPSRLRQGRHAAESWRPIQLLRQGVAVPFRIPPERGLKYLAAQIVQASVGVVGFQKMEEHMASASPCADDATKVRREHAGRPRRTGRQKRNLTVDASPIRDVPWMTKVMNHRSKSKISEAGSGLTR